jgi:hypothetical protein
MNTAGARSGGRQQFEGAARGGDRLQELKGGRMGQYKLQFQASR